jgi:hypothetical protein
MSGLALFALAIQFALSFGHFHPVHLSSGSKNSLLVAFVTSSDQNSIDHDTDYCDICAVTALASVTIVGSVPHLPLPDAVSRTRLQSGVIFGVFETRRLAFQSRAPPIS